MMVMEKIDRDMAARVWKRVQQASGQRETKKVPPEPPQLQELIARAWVDEALCRRLMSHYSGSDRMLLGEISRQKQGCRARLKGICAMQTGAPPKIPAPPIPRGKPEELLRLCCDGTARCAAQLEQLAVMPDYGRECAEMARQTYLQHRRLLGLLGKVK